MTVQAVGASRPLDRIRLTAINPSGAFRKHGAPPAFLLLLLLLGLTRPLCLHQNRALEQPAKFLLRHLLMRTPPAQRIRHRLVLHLQSIQLHDAIILAPLVPNLILLKFHTPDLSSALPQCANLFSRLQSPHRTFTAEMSAPPSLHSKLIGTRGSFL
jgi:hypothetical protein